jgi:hypothetical protein
MICKKVHMEGDAEPMDSHHGALPVEDLITVAVEDGSPMLEQDVVVLAEAFDISATELLATSTLSLEITGSP